MIEFLQYYLVFAIATAITSCYFFFWPCLKQAREDEIDSTLANTPLTSCAVYTVVATIMAPVLFLILFIPGVAQNYTDGLNNIIRDENS